MTVVNGRGSYGGRQAQRCAARQGSAQPLLPRDAHELRRRRPQRQNCQDAAAAICFRSVADAANPAVPRTHAPCRCNHTHPTRRAAAAAPKPCKRTFRSRGPLYCQARRSIRVARQAGDCFVASPLAMTYGGRSMVPVPSAHDSDARYHVGHAAGDGFARWPDAYGCVRGAAGRRCGAAPRLRVSGRHADGAGCEGTRGTSRPRVSATWSRRADLRCRWR